MEISWKYSVIPVVWEKRKHLDEIWYLCSLLQFDVINVFSLAKFIFKSLSSDKKNAVCNSVEM